MNFRLATLGLGLAVFAVCSSGCSSRTTTYTSVSGGPTIRVVNPGDCVWFQGPEVWGSWQYINPTASAGLSETDAKLGVIPLPAEVYFVCGRVPPVTGTPDTNGTDGTDGGSPGTDGGTALGNDDGGDTSDGCAPARVTHNGRCHEVNPQQCESNGKHNGWTASEVPCR